MYTYILFHDNRKKIVYYDDDHHLRFQVFRIDNRCTSIQASRRVLTRKNEKPSTADHKNI